MRYIFISVISLFLAGIVTVSTTQAATSAEETAAKIKTLITQMEALQKQLAALKGEVRTVLKDMDGEDVKKIQELLATDTTLYPEGKVTGFYGPLTKEAMKRFQTRHGVPATGEVDEDTKKLLEEYLKEGFGNKIPPGLLRAPGIMKKVQENLCIGGHKGSGPLCKRHHSDDDEDDDDHGHDDAFDVEVEIEDNKTTVTFTYDDETFTVAASSTAIGTIIKEVADELDERVRNLDKELVRAIKHAYAEEMDAIDADDEDDDDDEDEDEDDDDDD